jgi:hypothetical protein
MKLQKHPKLILILTAVVSFGAGYLSASNSRGPQPQFLAPSQPTAEAEAYVRHLTGADQSPYPTSQAKTWLPVNK